MVFVLSGRIAGRTQSFSDRRQRSRQPARQDRTSCDQTPAEKLFADDQAEKSIQASKNVELRSCEKARYDDARN